MAEEDVGVVVKGAGSAKEKTGGQAEQANESDSPEVTTPQSEEENIQLPAMKDGIESTTSPLVLPGRTEIPDSEGFSDFQFPSSLPRAAEISPWIVNGVVQASQSHNPESANNDPIPEDPGTTGATANLVEAESVHVAMDINDGREQEPSSSLLALVVAAVGNLQDADGMISDIDQAELSPESSAMQDVASSTEQLMAAPGAHRSDTQMILAINEETGVTGTNPELGIFPRSSTALPDRHANYDDESGGVVNASHEEEPTIETDLAGHHPEIRSQDSEELQFRMSPSSDAAQDQPDGEQSIKATVFKGAEDVLSNASDDDEISPMAELCQSSLQINEKANPAEGDSMDLDDTTSMSAPQTERLPPEDEQTQVQINTASTAVIEEVKDNPLIKYSTKESRPEQATPSSDTQSTDSDSINAMITEEVSPSVRVNMHILPLDSAVSVDSEPTQPLTSAETDAAISDAIDRVPEKCERMLGSHVNSDNGPEKIVVGSQATTQGDDTSITSEKIHTTNEFSVERESPAAEKEEGLRASAFQEISILVSNSSNTKPTETVGSLVVRDSEEIPSSSQETVDMPKSDTMGGQPPVAKASVLEIDTSREHKRRESVDDHAGEDEQQTAIGRSAVQNKDEGMSDAPEPEPKNTENLKTTISSTDSDSSESQQLSGGKIEACVLEVLPGKDDSYSHDHQTCEQMHKNNTESRDEDEIMHDVPDAKTESETHKQVEAVASIENLRPAVLPKALDLSREIYNAPVQTERPGSSDSLTNDVMMIEASDAQQDHVMPQDQSNANHDKKTTVTTAEESPEPSSKRKRVIPDSDDDEGGLEESPTRPSTRQKSPEGALSPADDSQRTATASILHETQEPPIIETPSSSPKIEAALPPIQRTRPKTPNTSFKLPTLTKDKDKDSSRTLRSSPSPSPSPSTSTTQHQDPVMAELKAIKIASLKSKNAALRLDIENKRKKLEEAEEGLTQPAAETVRMHIKLLHEYNDIRDVGQGLIGMIADNRGVRIGDLYEEFGVDLRD